MAVIDLTLPVNRHMRGIPNLREYEENPTRCVVLSCMGKYNKITLKAVALNWMKTWSSPRTCCPGWRFSLI